MEIRLERVERKPTLVWVALRTVDMESSLHPGRNLESIRTRGSLLRLEAGPWDPQLFSAARTKQDGSPLPVLSQGRKRFSSILLESLSEPANEAEKDRKTD